MAINLSSASPHDPNNRLGDFVRQRRTDLGLTQQELAARCGIAQGNLSDIERGRTTFPTAWVRRALAQELGVSHVDLILAAGELTPDELGVTVVGGDTPGSVAREWDELKRLLSYDPATMVMAVLVVRGMVGELRKTPEMTLSWEGPDDLPKE